MAFTRRENPHIEVGNRLVTCDRCGFDYHIRDTIIQKGLRVCKEACKDNLDNQVRV